MIEIQGYSPMVVGDVDTAFIVDCTGAMNARNATLQSVGAPTITRTDKIPLNSNDINVSQITILNGNLMFGFTAQAGSNIASYKVAFPLTISGGTTINRYVIVSVVAARH